MAGEPSPPEEMAETTIRQIVKLLAPANKSDRRLMEAGVRGEYLEARTELLKSPPPGKRKRVEHKRDGARLQKLLPRVEKILRRTPNAAFFVADPGPSWGDTPEGRRAMAWSGLGILKAVARDLPRIGVHGGRDRYGPVSAKVACRLMLNLPTKERLTSGSRTSTFRKIAGLFCATLQGLPIKGDHEDELPDLERACEAVLADIKKRGDAAYR